MGQSEQIGAVVGCKRVIIRWGPICISILCAAFCWFAMTVSMKGRGETARKIEPIRASAFELVGNNGAVRARLAMVGDSASIKLFAVDGETVAELTALPAGGGELSLSYNNGHTRLAGVGFTVNEKNAILVVHGMGGDATIVATDVAAEIVANTSPGKSFETTIISGRGLSTPGVRIKNDASRSVVELGCRPNGDGFVEAKSGNEAVKRVMTAYECEPIR